MIEVFEGFGLGAGKSYYVVTRLLDLWRRGGTAYVIDTMDILWDECKRFVERRYGLLLEDSQYHSVSEEVILQIYEHTPPGTDDNPVVIVVDECHGKLNARDWSEHSKKGQGRELFDWATQSRHDCNDLWFISQSAHNIDKQIRRLATYVWRIRNTANWGSNIITMFLKGVRLVTFGWHTGAYFVVTQLDQDGKTRCGKKRWIDQEREIFACYRSRAMAGKRKRSGDAVGRLKLAKKVVRRPYLRWAICLFLLAGGVTGCTKLVTHWTHHGDEKKEADGRTKTPAGKVEPQYEVRQEKFVRNFTGNDLVTEKFCYVQGEMSPDGLVEAIHAGTVKIRKPNGLVLYVVTNVDGAASIVGNSNAWNARLVRFQREASVTRAPASVTVYP